MNFLIYMMIITILIPFVMIFFGFYFYKRPPKKINSIYGYRTSRSMKSKDAWEFAHRYCGKLWFIGGWIMLALSTSPMFFYIDRDIKFITTLGLIIVIIQCVFLVVSIFPVEIALKRNFDENGNRKK